VRRAAWSLGIVLFATSERGAAEPAHALVHETGEEVVGEVAAYGAFGLDGAIGSTLGAAAGVPQLGLRANVAAFGDATWTVGNLDFDDFRVRAGLRAEALRRGALRLDVGFVPEVVATSNGAFTAQAFGTEVRLAPGIETPRWLVELDASLDQRWLTLVSFTDAYRSLAYAGARSGWYSTTSRSVRLGARAALRLSSVEVAIAGGWDETGALDVFPPWYCGIEVAWVRATH
jgi:hypothetical protein